MKGGAEGRDWAVIYHQVWGGQGRSRARSSVGFIHGLTFRLRVDRSDGFSQEVSCARLAIQFACVITSGLQHWPLREGCVAGSTCGKCSVVCMTPQVQRRHNSKGLLSDLVSSWYLVFVCFRESLCFDLVQKVSGTR